MTSKEAPQYSHPGAMASNGANPVNTTSSTSNAAAPGSQNKSAVTSNTSNPNIKSNWIGTSEQGSHAGSPLPDPLHQSGTYSMSLVDGTAMYQTKDAIIFREVSPSSNFERSSNGGGEQIQKPSNGLTYAHLEAEGHYYTPTELHSVSPSSTYQLNTTNDAYKYSYTPTPAYLPHDHASNPAEAYQLSGGSSAPIGMYPQSSTPTSKQMSTTVSKGASKKPPKAVKGASKDASKFMTTDPNFIPPEPWNRNQCGKWTSTELSVLKYWQQDDQREALALNFGNKEIAEEVRKEIAWLRTQNDPTVKLPKNERKYNANTVGHKIIWLDDNPVGVNPLAPRNPQLRTTRFEGTVRARRARPSKSIKLDSGKVGNEGDGTVYTVTQKPQDDMIGESVLSHIREVTNGAPSRFLYSSNDKFQPANFMQPPKSALAGGMDPNPDGELWSTETVNLPEGHGRDNPQIQSALQSLIETTGFGVYNQRFQGDPLIDPFLASNIDIYPSLAVVAGDVLSSPREQQSFGFDDSHMEHGGQKLTSSSQVTQNADNQFKELPSGNRATQNGSLGSFIDRFPPGFAQKFSGSENPRTSTTKLNGGDGFGSGFVHDSVNVSQHHSWRNQSPVSQPTDAIADSTVSSLAKYGPPPSKPIFSSEDISEQLQINFRPQQSLHPAYNGSSQPSYGGSGQHQQLTNAQLNYHRALVIDQAQAKAHVQAQSSHAFNGDSQQNQFLPSCEATSAAQTHQTRTQAEAQKFPGQHGVSQPNSFLSSFQPGSRSNSLQDLGPSKSDNGTYKFHGESIHGFVRTFDHDEMRRQHNSQNNISYKTGKTSSIPLLETKDYQGFKQALKDVASRGPISTVESHDNTGDNHRANQQIGASSQLWERQDSEMPVALSQRPEHPTTDPVSQNEPSDFYFNDLLSLTHHQNAAYPNSSVPLSSSQEASSFHTDAPAAKKPKTAGWGFINGENYDYLNSLINQKQALRPSFSDYNTQAGSSSKQTPLTGITYEDRGMPTQGPGVTGVGGMQNKRNRDDMNAGGENAPQNQPIFKQAADRAILQTRPPMSSSTAAVAGGQALASGPSKRVINQQTPRNIKSYNSFSTMIGKTGSSNTPSKKMNTQDNTSVALQSGTILDHRSAVNISQDGSQIHNTSGTSTGDENQYDPLLLTSTEAQSLTTPGAQDETPLYVYRGQGKVTFNNSEGTPEKKTWVDDHKWKEKVYVTGIHPTVASANYPPALVGQPGDRMTGYPPLDLAPRMQWNKDFEDKQAKMKRKREEDNDNCEEDQDKAEGV